MIDAIGLVVAAVAAAFGWWGLRRWRRKKQAIKAEVKFTPAGKGK